MPTIPCPDYLFDCDCSNSPVRNFSAEAVDVATYFGTYNQPPSGPLGPFVSTGCQAICESTVSQEAADECARDQAFLCSAPPGVPVYRGGTQTCTVECDDGLSFSWTEPVTGGLSGVIPGGIPTFPISNTTGGGGGDAQRPITGIEISSSPMMALCFGEVIFNPIQLQSTNPVGPYDLDFFNYKVWTITKGDIPPGLTFSRDGKFTGTPTTAGIYTFTVALDHVVGVGQQHGDVQLDRIIPFHLHATKDFTFRIIEIITDQVLPDATWGAAYNTTISAIGTMDGNQWSVVPQSGIDQDIAASFNLPPGLTIDTDTGIISGTPDFSRDTLPATYNFILNFRDMHGGPLSHLCQKSFQITVNH